MRIAAGAARLEAREFLEGTALNPLLHGRRLVDLVAVDDALDLHDGSIDLEVGVPYLVHRGVATYARDSYAIHTRF